MSLPEQVVVVRQSLGPILVETEQMGRTACLATPRSVQRPRPGIHPHPWLCRVAQEPSVQAPVPVWLCFLGGPCVFSSQLRVPGLSWGRCCPCLEKFWAPGLQR